ncbi:hypothetical protein CCASEI_02845 [Corynebacterium casei LMG S-19264]|uniref:Uncharacterized protein n=1 Tax=Corynebacterium casei LMG S-19264 TaxID=1285583 RepID=A0ABM5PML4_9CORY|nr:hypothetical protein CCASEI_02845 [Corynebacterium casei LMG S-19264]
MSSKSLGRIRDEGVSCVLAVCPAHGVVGHACVDTILAWNPPAINFEVAGIKEPNIIAVFYCAAGIATMRVIVGIGI